MRLPKFKERGGLHRMDRNDYIRYIVKMLKSINNIDVLELIYKIVYDFYTKD